LAHEADAKGSMHRLVLSCFPREGVVVIRVASMLVLIAWGGVCRVALAGGDGPMPFHLDPAQSRVWFDADARLHTFRGETQQLTGRFTLQRRSPPQLSDASVAIKAASLETGNAERDADMRRDFLEVERFPTIEFRVDEVLTPQATAGEATWDLVLQGKLMVHGVIRDIKVPTTVSLSEERVTARGRIHLDMRDYSIRVPRLFLVPMKSEVLVAFEVVARPAR
jgi:polyisoprenoid-binding protein YceI